MTKTMTKMGRPRELPEDNKTVSFPYGAAEIAALNEMAEDVMGGNRSKLLRKIVNEEVARWKAQKKRRR